MKINLKTKNQIKSIIMTKFLLVLVLFLSLSSLVNANPFPVYFADVIKENKKEILHFEWRPDYQSYDKALITNDSGKVLAEISYPKNSYDITKLQEQRVLFITAVSINGEKSEAIKVELNKDYSSLYASGPAE